MIEENKETAKWAGVSKGWKMKNGWSWKGIVINKPTMATDHEKGSRTGKMDDRKERWGIGLKKLKMNESILMLYTKKKTVYYVLELNEIPSDLAISHWAADQ